MDNVNLNPYKYPQITCDNCGHNIFRSAFVLNKVPGLLVGYGHEDVEYPTQVFICDKCGTMLKSFRDDIEKLSKLSDTDLQPPHSYKENEQKKTTLIL